MGKKPICSCGKCYAKPYNGSFYWECSEFDNQTTVCGETGCDTAIEYQEFKYCPYCRDELEDDGTVGKIKDLERNEFLLSTINSFNISLIRTKDKIKVSNVDSDGIGLGIWVGTTDVIFAIEQFLDYMNVKERLICQ